MIEILAGILFGIAAHQTDRVVKVWPTNWEYISRYIIGYLTCGFTFTLIMKKICPHGLKDGLLAFGGAGISWDKVSNIAPRNRARMITFKDNLLIIGQHQIYCINSNHIISENILPFTTSLISYHSITEDGEYAYILEEGNNNFVWRSADLINWFPYTRVENALSICWWSGVGLMIADTGLNARIWRA